MNDFVELDTKKVDEMLATLSNEQIVQDILNEGLEAMGQVYYNEIVSSLRREMGTAADTSGNHKGWHSFNYPLSSGIGTHPEPQNTIYGVHALKDPRLNWYEGGTKQRFTKGSKITGYVTNKRTGKVNYNRLQRTGKGGYRGILTANHFFTKGVTSAENPAQNALVESVIKAIRNRGIDITQ